MLSCFNTNIMLDNVIKYLMNEPFMLSIFFNFNYSDCCCLHFYIYVCFSWWKMTIFSGK